MPSTTPSPKPTRNVFSALERLAALILLLPGAAFGAEPLKFPSIPPTSPAEAEKAFHTLHGFHMDLLAAEPMVASPVAMAYDEDGHAFVAEMVDYPYTDKAHHKANQENPTDAPIGRIRMLFDDDGDGKFDRSTIFAEGLSWPTGIACWKGGIIVTATPDVWYFKDTKGDGHADARQKLFTGLRKFNVQAVMNNPVWGLDNRLYISGGSNGGEIRNLMHPELKPLSLRRADLRLDPRNNLLELVSGGARFGNGRDDWGNRFLCNIRNPAQHIAIESRYLARNPYLPVVSALTDVAESGDQLPVYRVSPPEAWRELRAKRWSADSTVTAHMPRSELVGSGVVTSSSGITVYRGDAYPAEFYGNLIVADCAGNLFYRLKTRPDGVTFKASRVDGKQELCAGRDIWFRPVNFVNAPDGCLHVCDMYREVIEHPWSLPDDIHAALDLERGRDRGRLYRLAPPGFQPRPAPHLSKASTAELVALLAHPNAWHRDTAHRLLFERQDQSAVPALREMMSKNQNPLARLQALWSLEGLGALNETDIVAATHDSDEHMRRAAVLLAEPRLKESESLRMAVMHLTDDAALGVRYQVALSLGEVPDAAAKPLAALASHEVADSWMRTAILSSAGAHTAEVAAAVLRGADSPDAATFLRDAGGVIGGEAKADICRAFLDLLAGEAAAHASSAEAGALGLAKGLARHSQSPTTFASPAAQDWLRAVSAKAQSGALAAKASVEQRTESVALLALADFSAMQSLAGKLLQPSQPEPVCVAFIQSLRDKRDPGVATLLLTAWPALTPGAREAAVGVFTSRKEWLEPLIVAVEKQQIHPAELSPAARAALQRFPDVALRERAGKLFVAAGSRQDAITRYQPVLTMHGDATKGHEVYRAICSTCHRKGDEGRDIGPNLATVGAWSPEQLLTNILDPNREVAPNFMLYAVELKDGRALAGIIAAETETGVTLKSLDGTEQSFARTEIASLKATGTSPMPEGLEGAVNMQQMADLVAFLRDAP
ncbi:putative membrane-bound dehydrogenase-like protein [Chthoniobacter flavus]|nr:PVC-type heme-binding CxxCH protein [Chthoniobacter flavus]TCO91909.1 putative membrane-bound dehydrogenase-like protein [Chthoniobacter flavus]